MSITPLVAGYVNMAHIMRSYFSANAWGRRSDIIRRNNRFLYSMISVVSVIDICK